MEKQKTNINMKEFKLFILSCFAIICVALFGSVLTSCSNDDDLLLAGDTQTEQVSTLAQDSVKAVTRSSSDIAAGTYNVFSQYKTAYVHKKQGSTGCGPLNYVLCVRAIARGNNSNSTYASDITAKYNHVVEKKGTAASANALLSYFNQYDANTTGLSAYTVSEPHSNAGKDAIVEDMLYHFADNHTPFVFLGAMMGNSGNWIGHYYIVWNITWTKNFNTSLIYVTDTTDNEQSSFDNQIKSYTLSQFLSNAMNNPQSNNFWLLCFYWIKIQKL